MFFSFKTHTGAAYPKGYMSFRRPVERNTKNGVRSYVIGQTASRWCVAEIWKGGARAQMSSSSPHRGSKRRDPSKIALVLSSCIVIENTELYKISQLTY
ncbi:hypothetical protein AVEN_107558-1 [Araneus ventricosus]|uniref:Uncharacterized protein n=1 Tax=Araneus ventricosus TaxID=182803 RepID=A0A4Y2W2Z8_ARAVE|nr:hypothetical protein AVEN_3508-1 [Araneus ventricosus]GBO31253.1 hypothetical protein AVEN_143124-1 [Araneus ventricosus]GBO31265.1 hypothetical protein AVEN_269672-1 [Araneus ventricosus]GBO31267.1 hypothetical protein AVEN_107558-1 [Araneus ventricosus]